MNKKRKKKVIALSVFAIIFLLVVGVIFAYLFMGDSDNVLSYDDFLDICNEDYGTAYIPTYLSGQQQQDETYCACDFALPHPAGGTQAGRVLYEDVKEPNTDYMFIFKHECLGFVY